MKNDRISAKERGLLKGAIRRVFSRSDLRKQAIAIAKVDYTDPNRPRVKKWGRCAVCKELTPAYLLEIDHMVPIVPLDSSLEQMSWDDLVNRVWCPLDSLQAICKPCHKIKSSLENKQRRAAKKACSKR